MSIFPTNAFIPQRQFVWILFTAILNIESRDFHILGVWKRASEGIWDIVNLISHLILSTCIGLWDFTLNLISAPVYYLLIFLKLILGYLPIGFIQFVLFTSKKLLESKLFTVWPKLFTSLSLEWLASQLYSMFVSHEFLEDYIEFQ